MLVALRVLQRSGEDGPVPKLRAVDPYLIAYLRGGRPEAIRTAVLSLIDRRVYGDTQVVFYRAPRPNAGISPAFG